MCIVMDIFIITMDVRLGRRGQLRSNVELKQEHGVDLQGNLHYSMDDWNLFM
jgi:hypothetical protein